MISFKRRLPALPLKLSRPTGTSCRRIASAVLLLVGGWWLGLFLFFPGSALEQRLETEVARGLGGQGRVTLSGLALHLPLTVAIDAATLHLPRSLVPEVTAEKLRLQPRWFTLATANPGLSFSGKLMDGAVTGSARKNGRLDLDMRQLQLTVPLLKNSALTLTGTLDRGELAGQWPVRPETATRLSLRLTDLRLSGLEALGVQGGALPIGTVLLEAGGTGNQLKVDRLESQGGDLTVTGDGNLLLAAPLEQSRLALAIRLQPGATLDPAMRELLTLLGPPDPSGAISLHLGGTLGKPRLQ